MEILEVFIKYEIDSDLSMKNDANRFFEKINSLESNEILINFKDTKFISRAFAQAYLSEKKLSSKIIKECNVPENIESLLKIVENDPKIDLKDLVSSR